MIRTLDIPAHYLNRVQALVAAAAGPIVVLDDDGEVVASNVAESEHENALVLHLSGSGYEELRAGFTAAVSHELRTPLARMLALLESATLPDADVPALVEEAQREVEQATELIDDILFLGELETGREVVSLGTTRAREVVDEVVAEYRARAEVAQVALVVRVAGGAELPLRRRMLRVVLENLVANAVRHAGAGSTCVIEVAGPELIVSDDGAGVGETDLARLFERFYRADRARSTRGSGLGLAIVKHIVTRAGGTVEARGGRRRGLTVVCTFPSD
jgi:signal transduction histidine kinase